MDITKSETPEDEREISLNESSLKKTLDVVDVIGGHGPWQFRQWIVFFAATLCNGMVVFSALFLPSQTYCFSENSTGTHIEKAAIPDTNTSTHLSTMRNYVKGNASVFPEVGCNSTNCKTTVNVSGVSSAKLLYEVECWNSQVEIFVKCSYVIACLLSCVLVYFSNERFGRRPFALFSCLFLVCSSLATSWTNAPFVFLILRFITSLGVLNIYLVSAFTLMEYVHKDFKLLYFFTGHLGWGMSHFLLPLVAWLTKDWMSFNISLSACGVVLSIFMWWGPESPSSYPKGGEITRTRKMLKYAAFINGYSTTDVDLLTHNFRTRSESKHDVGSLPSAKTKILCLIYSSSLFMISFTTSFLYFATKWHPEWFKVDSRRISFAFLGTTEIASAIILLFLTSVVAIKYLWACVSVMTSILLLVIYSRTKEGSSKSSALLFTVTAFFASAAWTLVLAKSFCHKTSNVILKSNLIVSSIAVFAGSLAASAVILKADDKDVLLVFAIPHLIFAAITALLPDHIFGTVS